jgi:hypothetical protein
VKNDNDNSKWNARALSEAVHTQGEIRRKFRIVRLAISQTLAESLRQVRICKNRFSICILTRCVIEKFVDEWCCNFGCVGFKINVLTCATKQRQELVSGIVNVGTYLTEKGAIVFDLIVLVDILQVELILVVVLLHKVGDVTR